MSLENKYLRPSISPLNIDLYIIRREILSELKTALPKLSGTLLDVGCGYSPYKSLVLDPKANVQKYIGLDLENNAYQQPDLIWDGKKIPLEDNSIDCALMTEVLEHCPEPGQVLGEVYRVLKSSGVIFLTTPFVWPLHDLPHDFFRYTPHGLESLLVKSGFVNIKVKTLGGWELVLAQMLGLWARRRSHSKAVRLFLLLLIWPFYLLLLLADSIFCVNEKQRSMFLSLSCLAAKPVENLK